MDNNIAKLAGSWPIHPRPFSLFSPIVMDFLQQLESKIRKSTLLSADTSYAALGFWLRRKHLESFQALTANYQYRFGRGAIFHITPTNIPIMFAYSFIISLLSGNSNIVRISPLIVEKVRPLWNAISQLLECNEFRDLEESNAIISYEKNSSTTDQLSAACDGRIIWGGNDSIREIRKSPLPPQAIELVFADRYSLAVFDGEALRDCTDDELALWAHHFYNDTYDLDQNACSSPKIIFWLAPPKTDISGVQKRWWQLVAENAAAYDLAPIKVSRKYTQLWQFSMTCPVLQKIEHFNNLLYVYTLSSLPSDITTLSGIFGQFFQYTITDLMDLMPLLSKKVQTISVLGMDKDKLRRKMVTCNVMGGDRIVSVGQAMNMDIVWDGFNMLEGLSRIISQE
jgi:hypothetical protein